MHMRWIFLCLVFLSSTVLAGDPRILFIERIRFPDGDIVRAGGVLRITLEIENEGDTELFGTSILATIPELGIAQRQGRESMQRGEVNNRQVMLEIPSDARQGWYAVRIFVSDDNSFALRKLYRWVHIKS